MGYQKIKLELLKLPKLSLKLVFLAHFILISWSTLGDWAHNAYLVHNVMLLTCLVWSLAMPDSEEPILLSLAINIVSVLLDIIILSIYYPRYDMTGLTKSKTAEFSAVIAIFNLLFRFVSSHLMYTEWSDRGGLVTLQTNKKMTVPHTTQGGSVRSGSVLAHYPGQFEGQVMQGPPGPPTAEKAALPPALPPPTYVANS